MSFWEGTHIDACRVKRWVRTLWRCKVDVEFLVEKPVWVRSWVASGETRVYSNKVKFPPSLIHHPVWIWFPSGPILGAEVKTNRIDFLPAGVLESVVEVAIWTVHSYNRFYSRICVVSSLVARSPVVVVVVQEGEWFKR